MCSVNVCRQPERLDRGKSKTEDQRNVVHWIRNFDEKLHNNIDEVWFHGTNSRLFIERYEKVCRNSISDNSTNSLQHCLSRISVDEHPPYLLTPHKMFPKPLTGNAHFTIHSGIVISHLRKFAFEMYFNPFSLPSGSLWDNDA